MPYTLSAAQIDCSAYTVMGTAPIRGGHVEGRLVRVGSGKVVTERPFELLARLDALRRPAVVALRDWLIAAAE